jgi:hypothetical protein
MILIVDAAKSGEVIAGLNSAGEHAFKIGVLKAA